MQCLIAAAVIAAALSSAPDKQPMAGTTVQRQSCSCAKRRALEPTSFLPTGPRADGPMFGMDMSKPVVGYPILPPAPKEP